ncbi:hypothetical protein B0H16DRAFT_1801039 [Mycena metata]|uniref:Uncharacterized protein n=1 Tax=Mycena metata TaxID=1033252 RepID=A0AAD7HAZ6_9AGAR|nr:hypothetical protein B0H16DRAFT_1801039 [Mycena metata]
MCGPYTLTLGCNCCFKSLNSRYRPYCTVQSFHWEFIMTASNTPELEQLEECSRKVCELRRATAAPTRCAATLRADRTTEPENELDNGCGLSRAQPAARYHAGRSCGDVVALTACVWVRALGNTEQCTRGLNARDASGSKQEDVTARADLWHSVSRRGQLASVPARRVGGEQGDKGRCGLAHLVTSPRSDPRRMRASNGAPSYSARILECRIVASSLRRLFTVYELKDTSGFKDSLDWSYLCVQGYKDREEIEEGSPVMARSRVEQGSLRKPMASSRMKSSRLATIWLRIRETNKEGEKESK